MPGLNSAKMAQGFVQDFKDDPSAWVSDPDSTEGKAHKSVLSSLAKVGLPAGLALAAYAIAKRDGMGMQAAIASLSGYTQGAKAASELARQHAQERQQTERQGRLDKQNSILGIMPVIDSLGGDANGLAQLYGQNAGIQVPTVRDPVQRKAEETALKFYTSSLDAANPRQTGDAFAKIGELTGSQAMIDLGKSIGQTATIGEDEVAKAAVSLYAPLSKLTHDQQIAVIRQPWMQKALASLVERAGKPEDPYASDKHDLTRSQIGATDALRDLRNRTSGTTGQAGLSQPQIQAWSHKIASAVSTVQTEDLLRGKVLKSQDQKKYLDALGLASTYLGQGYSQEQAIAQVRLDLGGNPDTLSSVSDQINAAFGIAGPDSTEAEEYAQ